MGLKPRGFIAALLAAATLLTGGTTAFAADTAQGLSGDVGGTAGGGVSQPSATPSTGVGGDAARTEDTGDGDAGRKDDAAPKATPETKATPTPDASKGRQGRMAVRAVVNTSLDGVTTSLYRIGDYPAGVTKARASSLSWDDLHVVSTDAVVKDLASKAAMRAGVNVSGDPVDAIAHDLDPDSTPVALDALASGLAAGGVAPAATVSGERTVSLPEGVYLAVPNTPSPVASVGLTTLDGADALADWGLGGADVQGHDTQPPVGDLPSPGQADGDTGLLSRAMSLFGLKATRASSAQPFYLRWKNLVTYWVPGTNPKVYTGIFYLTGDQAGNGARTMALCTQAWANTPPDRTLYHQFAYGGPNSGFGRTTDQMRSVVYYSDTILKNMGQNQKLAWMHYAFSYIHNQGTKNQTAGIPSAVLNHGQFKKLVDMAMNHAVGADTGIRMIFYRPEPVNAGQALVGWTRTPTWTPSIHTRAQYLPSRTAGWKSSTRTTIGLTNSLRDVVTITVKRHYSDDWFVIESHLNVDTNGDKNPRRRRPSNAWSTTTGRARRTSPARP